MPCGATSTRYAIAVAACPAPRARGSRSRWSRRAGRTQQVLTPRSIPVPYGGWSAVKTELRLPDGSAAPCHPLVRTVATPPGGLSAEVIDLGRGTPGEFEAHASEIPGRIVLVRHELMFAAGTIHRRLKYDMAQKAGALGFLIAGPVSGSLVSGSSGRDGIEGIPAAGIPPEWAARLRRTAAGWPRVTLEIATNERPANTETLLFDIPGRTDEWVVLSAHVDGHDLAESAMDNATGVAAALSAVRAMCSDPAPRMRGLRLAFFSVEEWALTGSAQYVNGLSESERAKIALNVNLDSIGGSPNLSALTSGFRGLEPFLLRVAEANGIRATDSAPADVEFRSRELRTSGHSGFSSRRRVRRAGRKLAFCSDRPRSA